MTPEQKRWLEERPHFTQWSPHNWTSTMGWTDVGYLTPAGEFVLGEKKLLMGLGGACSLGDTIYLPDALILKVGREYSLC